MSNRIELPVSAHAARQIQRLFEAAQGGKLKCVEREDGSKIYYIKRDLDENFLRKLLYGKPGPKRAAPVLQLLVKREGQAFAAQHHVQHRLPELFPDDQGKRVRALGKA